MSNFFVVIWKNSEFSRSKRATRTRELALTLERPQRLADVGTTHVVDVWAFHVTRGVRRV